MSLGFVLGCTVVVQSYVLRRLRFDWPHIEYIRAIAQTFLAKMPRTPSQARTSAPAALLRPAPGADQR